MDIPTLETERLRLRPFRPDDCDAYAEMCSDPEVMRHLTGAPLTRAESWRHLAFILGHWQLRGYGMWAVEEKGSGAFLGRIGFNHPEGWPGFELGWILLRRYWGRGFATEGTRAALAHAFEVLDRTTPSASSFRTTAPRSAWPSASARPWKAAPRSWGRSAWCTGSTGCRKRVP